MPIRYPAPLVPGDTIGVTSPSSGVARDLQARLDFCVEDLRRHGFQVVVGGCMDGSGVVSAPARARADELTALAAAVVVVDQPGQVGETGLLASPDGLLDRVEH